MFWLSLLFAAICCIVTNFFLQKWGILLSEIGVRWRQYSNQDDDNDNELDTDLSGDLEQPLLSSHDNHDENYVSDRRVDSNAEDKNTNECGGEKVTGEIGAEANYKAGLKDLLALCYPDLNLLVLAFLFLILAAITQVSNHYICFKIPNVTIERSHFSRTNEYII